MDGKLLLKFNQSLLGKWICCVCIVHIKKPQVVGGEALGFSKTSLP